MSDSVLDIVLTGMGLLSSVPSLAEVPLYDFRQPVRDGVILVGMECNHREKALEFGIFYAGDPPTKRMDLWKTSGLVSYDLATNMVEHIGQIERACTIGKDHYRVRFKGLPGALNAMWMCGAVVTATASVWNNGRLIYEQDLSRCGAEDGVRRARFVPGSNVPTVVKDNW